MSLNERVPVAVLPESESRLVELGRNLESARVLPGSMGAWLGFLLVTGVLLVRFGGLLWTGERLIDEAVYLAAFEAVLRSESPYDVAGFLYPPAFSHAGAWAVDGLGGERTLGLLRLANFMGLLGIACFVGFWVRAAGRRADGWVWGGTAAALSVSTGVLFALGCANVSFLAAGLLLWGLRLASRRPVWAGICLALSVSVKPFAAPAIWVLFWAGSRSRRLDWLSASSVALLVGGMMNLASPWVWRMHEAAPSPLTDVRSTSLARMGALLGLDLDPLVWLALGLAALGLGAWRWSHVPAAVQMLGLLGVLTMPVVWNHTLVVLLPMVASAGVLAWTRRRAELARWFEPVGVGLAGLSLLLFESGAVDRLAAGPQLALLSPPFLAAIGLFLYWVRMGSRVPAAADETGELAGMGEPRLHP